MNTKSSILAVAVTVNLLGGTISVMAQDWILTSAPTNYLWKSLAMSADGSKLVAAAEAVDSPPIPGAVYVSTNSGGTWMRTLLSSSLDCQAAASSADGSRVIVAMHGRGGTNWVPVYRSVDSGMTWTQTLVPSLYFSQSVASSADGNKLAVAGYYAWGAPICLSTNAGATWVTSSAPVKNWSAIASSADGTKLAATAKGGQEIVGDQPVTVIGMIYTSTNAGATWMPSSAPRTNWYSIASSADGSKLVAAVMSGFVYTSTNSGDTWTKTAAPATTWYSVASSADGQKLLAVGMHSLYSSTDSGVTWISNNVALGWYTSACSADGNLRVVPASGNHIALSRSIPQPVLDIGSSPDSLAVSWIVPSTNFALQCATTCGTGWADVATPPVMNLTNLKYEVVLPLTNSMGFFRLESR